MDMYTFLESARQGASDELIKTPKKLKFFSDPMGVSANRKMLILTSKNRFFGHGQEKQN